MKGANILRTRIMGNGRDSKVVSGIENWEKKLIADSRKYY